MNKQIEAYEWARMSCRLTYNSKAAVSVDCRSLPYRHPRRPARLNGKANSQMVVDTTRFGRFINISSEQRAAVCHYPISKGTQNVKLLGGVHIAARRAYTTTNQLQLAASTLLITKACVHMVK